MADITDTQGLPSAIQQVYGGRKPIRPARIGGGRYVRRKKTAPDPQGIKATLSPRLRNVAGR